MRVLYVNHTAVVSGGERSLLALLAALPNEVLAHVATPTGSLRREVEALGLSTTAIMGTAGSLRLHPLHTPRALAEMALAARQLRRAAERHGAELVHANSIRAGLVAALAYPPRAAIVVHVRDVLPPGPVTTTTMRTIASTATTIVANSHYTARSVSTAAPRARVEVVHNPVDLARFDPDEVDRSTARARLGDAGRRAVVLGVVAQLSPWKGQDTAIEALELLVGDGFDAHLLLVGSAKFIARATRFDNEAYVARLRELVARAGLQERVSWLGEREDVPELIRAMDVLLLPSWEEPFGRALIEAMALEVPVLATNVGGPPEIVRDGREGFLLAPRQPREWAAAIRRLVEDPGRAAKIGSAGRARAQREFSVSRHVDAMLDVYGRAIGRRAR